jgi:hypothetical protein
MRESTGCDILKQQNFWQAMRGQTMAVKKANKIIIEKEKLRPKERAPILPSKKIEDKRVKEERREKHRKDLRRQMEE